MTRLAKNLIIIASALFSCIQLTAQTQGTPFDRLAEQFREGKYPAKHCDFPYRYTLMNPDAAGNPALVVILHSSSYSGDNNISQLRPYPVRRTMEFIAKRGMKAFLFIPQCRADRWWSEDYATIGDPMHKILKGALDNFISNEGIDPTRIYIIGGASGGAGVFKMADRYPGFFAGGLIVGSYPKDVSASRMRATPLCISVAEKDRAVNVADVQALVEKIRKGGEVRYDLVPECDGMGIATEGFSDENLGWTFSHSRTGK